MWILSTKEATSLLFSDYCKYIHKLKWNPEWLIFVNNIPCICFDAVVIADQCTSTFLRSIVLP